MTAPRSPGGGTSSTRLPTIRSTWATLRFGFDPRAEFMRSLCAAEFTRARLGARRYVVLRRADEVDHVLHTRRLNYVKSQEYETARAVSGTNLLTDEGDSWAEHRSAVNPMFARRKLDALVDLMIAPVIALADDLDSPGGAGGTGPAGGRHTVDLHEQMVQLTLRVVAGALFREDFGDVVERMHDLVDDGMRIAEVLMRLGLVGLLPTWVWRRVIGPLSLCPVPLPPPLARVQQIGTGLDRAVTAVIAARRARPTSEPDLLNLLLDAEAGSGDAAPTDPATGTRPWSERRVRDEALTFMLAGHETTANALSWFWYLMALHPDHRRAMLTEIDGVLGTRQLTSEDLPDLPWTTACVMESQRYFSAVPVVIRTALEDDVIGTHHIRGGTTVFIPIHTIHHDERYWPDPDSFDPRRFMPGARRPVRSTYLPFGGGRRICIGQSFALMEMVVVAATLSQRFVFDLEPGHPVVPAQSLTLRPRYGLRAVVRRRDAAGGGARPGTGHSS